MYIAEEVADKIVESLALYQPNENCYKIELSLVPEAHFGFDAAIFMTLCAV